MSTDPYGSKTPWDYQTFDKVVLEKIPVYAQQAINREVIDGLSNLHVEAFMEDAIYSLILRVRADVFAEKLGTHRIPIEFAAHPATYFPTSPWQFFKQRHEDSWWLARFVRRWPVRVECHLLPPIRQTRYVHQEEFAIFPDMKTPPALRGSDRVVRFTRLSEA